MKDKIVVQKILFYAIQKLIFLHLHDFTNFVAMSSPILWTELVILINLQHSYLNRKLNVT